MSRGEHLCGHCTIKRFDVKSWGRAKVDSKGRGFRVMVEEIFDSADADQSREGLMWREAIRAHRAGEPGIPAREAIRDLAEELGLEL